MSAAAVVTNPTTGKEHLAIKVRFSRPASRPDAVRPSAWALVCGQSVSARWTVTTWGSERVDPGALKQPCKACWRTLDALDAAVATREAAGIRQGAPPELMWPPQPADEPDAPREEGAAVTAQV